MEPRSSLLHAPNQFKADMLATQLAQHMRRLPCHCWRLVSTQQDLSCNAENNEMDEEAQYAPTPGQQAGKRSRRSSNADRQFLCRHYSDSSDDGSGSSRGHAAHPTAAASRSKRSRLSPEVNLHAAGLHAQHSAGTKTHEGAGTAHTAAQARQPSGELMPGDEAVWEEDAGLQQQLPHEPKRGRGGTGMRIFDTGLTSDAGQAGNEIVDRRCSGLLAPTRACKSAAVPQACMQCFDIRSYCSLQACVEVALSVTAG